MFDWGVLIFSAILTIVLYLLIPLTICYFVNLKANVRPLKTIIIINNAVFFIFINILALVADSDDPVSATAVVLWTSICILIAEKVIRPAKERNTSNGFDPIPAKAKELLMLEVQRLLKQSDLPDRLRIQGEIVSSYILREAESGVSTNTIIEVLKSKKDLNQFKNKIEDYGRLTLHFGAMTYILSKEFINHSKEDLLDAISIFWINGSLLIGTEVFSVELMTKHFATVSHVLLNNEMSKKIGKIFVREIVDEAVLPQDIIKTIEAAQMLEREKEAQRRGMTVNQLNQIKIIEKENEKLRAQHEQASERLLMQGLEAITEKYPSFNPDEGRKNGELVKLIQAGANPVSSYEVICKEAVAPQEIDLPPVDESLVDMFCAYIYSRLEEYEHDLQVGLPSCKDDLMRVIDGNYDEEDMRDESIDEKAFISILGIVQAFVQENQHKDYRGNERLYGKTLRHVYERNLQWGLQEHIITKRDYLEYSRDLEAMY